MTDPEDAKMPIDGQGAKRRRTRNHGDRRTVSLRMDPELHEHIVDLCGGLGIPADTYISGSIEIGLKKRKK